MATSKDKPGPPNGPVIPLWSDSRQKNEIWNTKIHNLVEFSCRFPLALSLRRELYVNVP